MVLTSYATKRVVVEPGRVRLVDAHEATMAETGSEASELVSVVMPIFNDEDTVRESLTSILLQSHKNLQVVVVDDGSTDRSASIAYETAGSDRRVELVRAGHGGTALAKNTGFRAARGDIVMFAESDALYAEDYISSSLEALNQDKNAGAVCVLGGIWETRRTFVTRSIVTENYLKHKLMHSGRSKPFYAWVFRRSVLDSVGLYDPNLKQGEDRDLFRRVQSRGYGVALVEGVHWGHKRNETAWEYAKKSFSKAKSRVLYVAKNRLAAEFFKGVLGLWVLAILLLTSILDPAIFPLFMSLIIISLVFLVLRSFYRGSNSGATKTGLALLPLLEILRYFPSALGYTIGLAQYSVRKVVGKQTRWSDLTR